MDNPQKILIVEDDQFIRELYSRELQKEGYNVDMCGDAEQAKKKLKSKG